MNVFVSGAAGTGFITSMVPFLLVFVVVFLCFAIPAHREKVEQKLTPNKDENLSTAEQTAQEDASPQLGGRASDSEEFDFDLGVLADEYEA